MENHSAGNSRNTHVTSQILIGVLKSSRVLILSYLLMSSHVCSKSIKKEKEQVIICMDGKVIMKPFLKTVKKLKRGEEGEE
jgi:hypothetical protein